MLVKIKARFTASTFFFKNHNGNTLLILTRRIGETIMIGDDVHINVMGVTGNQVKIGINAPRKLHFHREKVYQKIQRDKGGTE